MLKRVLVHITVTETQQVSTNGNSVLHCASLVKLAINTLNQRQTSVMDKKLASTICAKLSMEHYAVSTS